MRNKNEKKTYLDIFNKSELSRLAELTLHERKSLFLYLKHGVPHKIPDTKIEKIIHEINQSTHKIINQLKKSS